MTKQRVLLLNNHRPPLGGAEQHVATIEQLLRQHGHDVELLVPASRHGVRAWTDRLHNGAFAKLVKQRIRETQPNVVHVHNFLKRVSVAPFAVARRLDVPTVLTVHDFQLVCPRTWAVHADGTPCAGPEFSRCLFGGCKGTGSGLAAQAAGSLNALRRPLLARRVAELATTITAPSRALRDRLCGVLGRDVEHLPYPFEAVDALVPPSTRRLLFLGRVAPEKGLTELLGAMRDVAGVELTIAGEGPASDDLRRQVDDEGLANRVTFVGHTPHDQVRALLAAHGAVVVPSLWMDNSPLVVHEALAAGRPVLGARRGGIPELVTHGEHGWLFEPNDRAEIAAALRQFLEQTDEQHQVLATNAWQRAAAGNPQQFVERLLQTYDRATAAREVTA